MFYGIKSEKPLLGFRKMIFCDTTEERVKALNENLPYMKSDIKATLKAMAAPVTMVNEHSLARIYTAQHGHHERYLQILGIGADQFEKHAESLKESNPMMGHKRYQTWRNLSEITEMQVRAIFEAAMELSKEGVEKYFPKL